MCGGMTGDVGPWGNGRRGVSRCSATFEQFVGQRVAHPVVLGYNRFSVGMIEDRMQQGAVRPSVQRP